VVPATLGRCDLTDRAPETARVRGAGCGIRIVRRLAESISVKTGRVDGVSSGETEGFGIRVLVDGAWGFASSHRLEPAEIDRVAGEAVRIARASATALREAVVLDDRPPANGRFETPVGEDPFAVPLEAKIGELVARTRHAPAGGLAFTESTYGAQREWKTFAATDGSFTEQVITHVGAGIEANAVRVDATTAGYRTPAEAGRAPVTVHRSLDLEVMPELADEGRHCSCARCPAGRS
jgi:TldD protein